ncbi:MAG: SLBB domain-containing protein [Candidatus Zixiibacteriota bacterium]
MQRTVSGLGAVVIFSVMFLCGTTFGEDYRIGPGDVLEIKFYQDPVLNATVTVDLTGKIALDVIGYTEAAGKTAEDLQLVIVRRISRLNKKISQAVVRVIQYNYQHVFVAGQVQTPGKLTFERIPDLWTILNEAGSVTEFGDLSRVTIIRGGDRAGEIEVVNVAKAISEGRVDKLPKVRRQDTIEVPRTPFGLSTRDIAQRVDVKNQFYVVGAVGRPGQLKYEENVDLLEALALAGGPTEDAKLDEVKVISKDGYYAQTIHLDLNRYANQAAVTRYILKREDVVVVPRRTRGFFSENLGTIAAVLGAITSGLLIYDQLRTNGDEVVQP